MGDFFTTAVRNMTLAEVEPLFQDSIQENIRLEYKRELPAGDAELKAVIAKAISAFANTYGGYMVIGIATDNLGNPIGMDGVRPINNLAQRVASICYEQVYPPLIPFVSNPISLKSGNVLYVVYQDISLDAPHFLTRRRGAYVRTSEFSQTFQAELATWEDLRFLANRRGLAVDRRLRLYERGRTRSGRMLPWSERQSPAALFVGLGPAFPARPLTDLPQLQETTQRAVVTTRPRAYPRGTAQSLHESIAYAEINDPPSYLEATIYGTCFSGDMLLFPDLNRIPFGALLTLVLVRIRFGCLFLRTCGFDGLMNLRAILFNSYAKTFYWTHPFPRTSETATMREHDEIVIEHEYPLHVMCNDIGAPAAEVFRAIAFGAGWQHTSPSGGSGELWLV